MKIPKQILPLIICIICTVNSQGQHLKNQFASGEITAFASPHETNESAVEYVSPRLPETRSAEFSQGISGLADYLSENTLYPQIARDNNMQGIVKVQFVVQVDGSVTDLKVVQSVHEVLDHSALNTLKKMPKWRPALVAGKAVAKRIILSVAFQLT